jgi:hypothetical protein
MKTMDRRMDALGAWEVWEVLRRRGNPFDVLGLREWVLHPERLTDGAVKAAFRAKSLRVHPGTWSRVVSSSLAWHAESGLTGGAVWADKCTEPGADEAFICVSEVRGSAPHQIAVDTVMRKDGRPTRPRGVLGFTGVRKAAYGEEPRDPRRRGDSLQLPQPVAGLLPKHNYLVGVVAGLAGCAQPAARQQLQGETTALEGAVGGADGGRPADGAEARRHGDARRRCQPCGRVAGRRAPQQGATSAGDRQGALSPPSSHGAHMESMEGPRQRTACLLAFPN